MSDWKFLQNMDEKEYWILHFNEVLYINTSKSVRIQLYVMIIFIISRYSDDEIQNVKYGFMKQLPISRCNLCINLSF